MAEGCGTGMRPPRLEPEVIWSPDVDKQQWVVIMLDNERNREVASWITIWNGPLDADIIAFTWREPVVEDLVIKGEKHQVHSLVVVVQLRLGSIV